MPNQLIVVHVKRPEQSRSVADAIAALFSEESHYAVLETWTSDSGRHIVFNLLPRSQFPKPGFVGNVVGRFAGLVGRAEARLPRPHLIQVGADGKTTLKVGHTTTSDEDWRKSLRVGGNRLHANDSGGMAAFCLVAKNGAPDGSTDSAGRYP